MVSKVRQDASNRSTQTKKNYIRKYNKCPPEAFDLTSGGHYKWVNMLKVYRPNSQTLSLSSDRFMPLSLAPWASLQPLQLSLS